MKIGYCCINKTLEIGTKTITLKKYLTLTKEKQIEVLKNITRINFDNLMKILIWNKEHNIKMFRVGSDMVPLSTHPESSYRFHEDVDIIAICNKIRNFCKENDIRLTIHPSEYLVLNSFNEIVVERSILDLEYHYQICKLLGIETINLHVGGVYGNKQTAIENFIINFNKLPYYLKKLIALENDDKSYNAEDVLSICEKLEIPMILDFHHNRILKSSTEIDLQKVLKTWKNLKPLCHLSSSKDENKIIRSHHDFISNEDWLWFNQLANDWFDVEFECKNKELAILNLKGII